MTEESGTVGATAAPDGAAALPLTIVGGYLGAGKTTLLNHVLRAAGGARLALVVNDFGDVNIDAELLGRASDGVSDGVIDLANGCLCCSLSDGLADTLQLLRSRRDEIDHVIIEASGVADPVRIAQYSAAFGFDVRRRVVVVDAELVRERAGDRFVGNTVLAQLRCAELFVVNKVDLVGDGELARLEEWLATVNPRASVLRSSFGRVPLAELLAGPPGEPDRTPHAGDHTHDEHAMHDGAFRTWTIVSDAVPTMHALVSALGALPPSIARAKGFVRLAEEPDRWQLVQRAGARTEITPHDSDRAPSPMPAPAVTLVLISESAGFDPGPFAVALGGRVLG